MIQLNPAQGSTVEAAKLREEWLARLAALFDTVEAWAKDAGWATRRIEKGMDDSRLGAYTAPMLLLQEGAARVMLEPIARFAPGADGVVDLYLMPAYDDIASLYFTAGQWRLHYMFPESPTVGTIREAEPVPFSKETLAQVLEAMSKHAA